MLYDLHTKRSKTESYQAPLLGEPRERYPQHLAAPAALRRPNAFLPT